MQEWFWLPKDEVLSGLRTGEEGLDAGEAKARLCEYGENVILERKKTPWWQVFLGQFKDLLVMILIGAAAVSMVTGDAGSAGVIFAVLLLNALLGTVQNQKAQKSLEGLKSLSSPQVRVRRAGLNVMIPAAQVVPGDILVLEAGDRIGADGRILESRGMKVNESSLTGESVSVEKQEELLWKTREQGRRTVENPGSSSQLVPLADRVNMIFSGSLVTDGRGTAVVTDTGMNTELGKIALMMNDTKEKKTPLQMSLDRFSGRLAAAIMALSALVFILGLYRGERPLEALMFAVALAVAAIPEALSSIVTIVQAMGTQKMAKEHAIIKDLKAVESLGCVSVICSDKTGTLTQNRMRVEEIFAGGRVYGEEEWLATEERPDAALSWLFRAAVLNNNALWSKGNTKDESGDPMENALLEMAFQGGMDPEQLRGDCPRTREWPFNSRRKRMSVVHKTEDGEILLVKGAPELLLDRCDGMILPSMGKLSFRPMTTYDRRQAERQNKDWAARGLRVLAFACRPWKGGKTEDPDQNLIFLGMTALVDPPRPESRAAVTAAAEAGIRTVMITGDHRETAAWQNQGKIVAMTGDGVNDAPALKKADIGVAMGLAGTEVSKEASSMILADDNFATIIKAVANGRNVYRNIKNAIQFLLSGNMAGIFCVIYTSLLGLPMPFAPVHLLFINLLTDSLPAIAIGMEPAEEGLLKGPPRNPREGILTLRFVRDILIQGGLIGAASLWSYGAGLRAGGEALASTMAFSTLTLARLLHGFNCRSKRLLWRCCLYLGYRRCLRQRIWNWDSF